MSYYLFAIIITVLGFVMVAIISGKRDLPSTKFGKEGDLCLNEKRFVSINGTDQGMFIHSTDSTNPVLLYVHGGPCFPNYFLFERFKPGLEDYFTVCYWEQRGGGLSYSKGMDGASITLQQLSSDAIEVSNYLRSRFGKAKIYIMAHSGGTAIALKAIAENPDLFHAYIAMGQITRQYESERFAFSYIRQQVQHSNKRRPLKALRKFNNLKTDKDIEAFYCSGVRDKLMHQLGIGTMREMHSVFKDIFIAVLRCRGYTAKEKLNLWRAKLLFIPGTPIRKETLWTDFAGLYPRLEVPVFFIHGKYDLTVNIDLAKDYYRILEAPLKGFYTFENSAHSPLFEEPEYFRQILESDILKGETGSADHDCRL